MEQNEARSAANQELVGGWLCLDFSNTVSTRTEASKCEYLSGFQELAGWSRHAQILGDRDAEILLERGDQRPDLATLVLDRARSLRETIFRVFAALARSRAPDACDVAALNAWLVQAFSHLRMAPSVAGFAWSWDVAQEDLDRMLWPIVRSAADLLTSEQLGRVRQCARVGCDWLFLDTSKNQSRRWCSMEMCGSRVKSRRYYHRRKSGR